MADKPIPFSAPMVRATLDGRKGQTRRILKPQPPQGIMYTLGNESWLPVEKRSPFRLHVEEWGNLGPMELRPEIKPNKAGFRVRSTDIPIPYTPGRRLWVREAWRTEARFDHLPPRDVPPGALVSYEADYDQEPNDGCRGRYRHARFMPRWASRITLEVTTVKVERLQEISEADAKVEGIERDCGDGCCWKDYTDASAACFNPLASFISLWQSLHGPGSWDENPWVAAVTFRRVP